MFDSRKLLNTVLLALVSLAPVSTFAQPTTTTHVVHVIGLDEIKPGAVGELSFDRETMVLTTGEHSASIPLHSVLAFSISHDNVPLIRGTKGKLAGMAPYGVGQAINATRPSADTLTILYRDGFNALHGTVLILPKGARDNVVTALAGTNITPSEYLKSGQFGSFESTPQTASHATEKQFSKPSVEVDLPTENVDGIPSAFPIVEYEELISQLTESGLFATVSRQGDARRRPDTLVLHVNIEDFKKGSARSRGVVPFTGATVIKTNVTLADLSGQTIFQKDVEGSKRTQGENLEAINSLAKKVRKELQKAPVLKSRL